MVKRSTVLIIGSGIAALQLARKLKSKMNVKILTKSSLLNGNSYKAQGGVAAALGSKDDPYKHCMDTLEAGRHHNDPEIVLEMTKQAPSLIKELVQQGCSFDSNERGELLLGMEGAHSEKRIVHGGGDATGRRIMDFLAEEIQDVPVIENIHIFDLILNNGQCIGAKGKYVDGKIESFYADHVVLATGGLGQIYSFTTSASTVTGDGVALAYRAGAEISDMEFIQFHPTLLYVEGKGRGLVSEAVRGDGGILVTEDGKRIMEGVHPLKDLAPRHVVSQTIYEYIKRGKKVYLDTSAIHDFEKRFPTVSALCKENGIDLNEKRIPVVPGCHFLMGGVNTDKYGRTNIKGLYAIGEVACTGVHGANRLASNSLLEGLFFGNNLANWLIFKRFEDGYRPIPLFNQKPIAPFLHLPDISTLQARMMDFVGIVRSREKLTEQMEWLEGYAAEDWVSVDLEHLTFEQLNGVFMLITSWLVTSSCLQRTESRGGHFRNDFPEEDNIQWLGKRIIHKRMVEKDEENEQIKVTVTT